MYLFENWKYFTLTLIITLILGYYLGLAISSVVDYRLREATLHMPKPKNNITIVVSKKPKKVSVKDNSKKIEKFINYKTSAKKPKSRRKSKSKSKSKVVKEHFTTSDVKKNSDKSKKSKSNLKKSESLGTTELSGAKLDNKYPYNPVLEQRDKYYNDILTDKELLSYAQNYKLNRKKELDSLDKTYIAYNYEDSGETYTNLDNSGNPVNTDHEIISMFKPLHLSNLNKAKKFNKDTWNMLPTSRKLCPDFKCQRNYMTCTSNHIPKFKKRKTEDPKQIIPK